MSVSVNTESLARRLAAALHIGRWERDEQNRLRRGDWMQSFVGCQIYVLDPLVDDVHFDDLCVGLAQEYRYGKMAREPYTVAEHSVIVSLYCERLAIERGWLPGEVHEVALEGLLHDGSEAYLKDIPSPLKHQPQMRFYRRLEDRWTDCIYARFGVHSTPRSAALVKEVDGRLLMDEIEAIMIDPDMWKRTHRYVGRVGLGAEINAMPWQQAATAFCQRFAELAPEYSEAN